MVTTKGLEQVWCLETDKQSKEALDSLQIPMDLNALEIEYQRLFMTDTPLISMKISNYGINRSEFSSFRQERGCPVVESGGSFCVGFFNCLLD